MLKSAVVLALVLPQLAECSLSRRIPTATALTWTAPTTNEDGTELLDLAGYRVYILPSNTAHDVTQNPTDLVTQTTVRLDQLQPGLYTAYVTAVDHAGNESQPSNEVTFLYGEAP